MNFNGNEKSGRSDPVVNGKKLESNLSTNFSAEVSEDITMKDFILRT